MDQNKNILDNGAGEGCVSFDLLFRYMEKNTSEMETLLVEKHLNTCDLCRRTIAETIRMEQNPITDSEEEEALGELKLTPQEQVEKIMKMASERTTEQYSEESDNVVKLPADPIKPPPLWRQYPQIAAVAVVFLIFVTWSGGISPLLTKMETDKEINSAWALLHDSLTYNVFSDARLSSDFQPRTSGKLMSTKANFIDRAEAHLLNALRNDPDNSRARQQLTEIYIREKNFTKADSILKETRKSAGNTAELLNNYGALYFEQGDWQQAEAAFSEAIAADARFLKARFNLALTKIQLQQPEEALLVLNEYVTLEKDDILKRAAQKIIQDIQQSGGNDP